MHRRPHGGPIRRAEGCAGPGPQPRAAPCPPRVLSSEDLLGSAREVVIDHHGARYRLRVTSQGKLILNK